MGLGRKRARGSPHGFVATQGEVPPRLGKARVPTEGDGERDAVAGRAISGAVSGASQAGTLAEADFQHMVCGS